MLRDDYILWIIFRLFVGIAMAIALGAIGALRMMLLVKTPLPSFRPASSSNNQFAEKEKKSGTFKQALAWTIVWISLAVIFAGIIIQL